MDSTLGIEVYRTEMHRDRRCRWMFATYDEVPLQANSAILGDQVSDPNFRFEVSDFYLNPVWNLVDHISSDYWSMLRIQNSLSRSTIRLQVAQ